jgi:O-acetyl-ADP-ribose deacetylase (regulator of RNase III)
MLASVVEVLKKEETSVKQVVFCLWGDEALEVFEEAAKKMLGSD